MSTINKIVELDGRYLMQVESSDKGIYYRGIDENSYEDYVAFLNFVYGKEN